MSVDNMKLESLALHHGYTSEATTKAAAVPIYQTTSYTFDDTQHGADLFDLKVPGNIYTREVYSKYYTCVDSPPHPMTYRMWQLGMSTLQINTK